jgi:hypothetical protein
LVFFFLILLWQREFNMNLMILLSLCIGAIVVLLRLIVDNGDVFVSKPVTTPSRPPVRGSIAAAGYTHEQ